ncbi:MAG: prepilin-type N-terminal cleavage/methylation domain-containing protein [Candidatus Omnitrophota bacterium]
MFSEKRAFTLIEILFVIIVIAVLAAIAIPRIVTSTATAKTNACLANQSIMDTQIEQYHMDTGNWPGTLATVTGNTSYFPDGAPTCPESGTYSMNGTTYRTSCSNSDH